MKKFKLQVNQLSKNTESERKELLEFLNEKNITKAKEFHESFPQYKKTPLVSLTSLAKEIGLKNIFLKDESHRFGLNAFKVLGGSFAMAKYLAEKLGKDISDLPYETLISEKTRKELGEITFVTATDGNHGRGVAWTANKLKQKSVVFMPKGSSLTRLNAILAENADATITEGNYDDCVRMADNYVKEHENSVVIQDTAWEGYEKIPAWIMQGYGTMALEALEQLEESDVRMPTHIFLQAGVGSFAGAIQGYFATKFSEKGPIVSIIEADLADCLYQSAVKNDGTPVTVGGEMQTLMAGLACGEPNTTGWKILSNYTKAFISADDSVAATGMRILAAPVGDDKRVVSGESGAVSTGLIYELMTKDEYKELKADLELNENSIVLLFSTEGDTDPVIYKEVVWEGRNRKLENK